MPEVGEVVLTMCRGHIVESEVVEINSDRYEPFTMRFIRHFPSGKKRLCLDLGQRWYITEGELFFCGLKQIERALEWKTKLGQEWEVKELEDVC